VKLGELVDEVLEDVPDAEGVELYFLAFPLQDGLVVLPALLCYIYEILSSCLSFALKFGSKAQLVVEGLDLCVEVALLVLSWVGGGVP
jgi:hypothetical protein